MLSNRCSETQQARSHNTDTPPNPALLSGLQLTPVSSICFCLKRALKSLSLQQGHEKQITSHAKKGTNFSLCNKEGLGTSCWFVYTFLSYSDHMNIQKSSGRYTRSPQQPCCHTQEAVRSLNLSLSSAHACLSDCLSVGSFLVLNQCSDHTGGV